MDHKKKTQVQLTLYRAICVWTLNPISFQYPHECFAQIVYFVQQASVKGHEMLTDMQNGLSFDKDSYKQY